MPGSFPVTASGLDEDALIAAVDLIGRTGATGFEIGYLDDEPGSGWYAHAQYRGARVTQEAPGPVEAAEALARRLLTGGRCRCGKLVALSDGGAVVHEGQVMMDGSAWGPEQAAAAGQCRWTRYGNRWVSACGAGRPEENAQRPPRQKRRRR